MDVAIKAEVTIPVIKSFGRAPKMAAKSEPASGAKSAI
jgi:hypothetical protein